MPRPNNWESRIGQFRYAYDWNGDGFSEIVAEVVDVTESAREKVKMPDGAVMCRGKKTGPLYDSKIEAALAEFVYETCQLHGHGLFWSREIKRDLTRTNRIRKILDVIDAIRMQS